MTGAWLCVKFLAVTFVVCKNCERLEFGLICLQKRYGKETKFQSIIDLDLGMLEPASCKTIVFASVRVPDGPISIFCLCKDTSSALYKNIKWTRDWFWLLPKSSKTWFKNAYFQVALRRVLGKQCNGVKRNLSNTYLNVEPKDLDTRDGAQLRSVFFHLPRSLALLIRQIHI